MRAEGERMSVNAGMRHVPDTPQVKSLYACDEARKLAFHTIKICANKNIFAAEYQEAVTNDLINTAKGIYLDAWMANNIRVGEDPEKWKRRKFLQEKSLLGCVRMLSLIGLAKCLFHLRGKKVKYWCELTVKTQHLLKKWAEADAKRYE